VVELRPPRPSAPPHAPRRRRLVVAGLAAAAVLVAVVVGSTVRDDRDDLEIGPPVSEPDASIPTTTMAPPPSPSALEQRAVAQARAFLEAEDMEDVWHMLGPQSREQLGGTFDQNMRGFLSSTREDLHLWRDADDLRITAVGVAERGDVHTSVVTVTATLGAPVPGDPPAGFSAYSFFVQDDGTSTWAEAYLPGQALDLIEVPSGEDGPPVLVPGTLLPVHGEPDQLGFVVLVDGEAIPEGDYVLEGSDTLTGVRLGYGYRAGAHHLAAAMVTADGTLALASYQIELLAPGA
jgi:hypothetical protein